VSLIDKFTKDLDGSAFNRSFYQADLSFDGMAIKVIGKAGVEAELNTWELKGHEPIEQLKIIRFKNGRCAVGVLDYGDLETVLLAEDKTYASCRTAFAAIGARFDAVFDKQR
jgi:hypothetical protein